MIATGHPLAPLLAYRQWIPVKLVPLANLKTDKLPIDYRTGAVVDAHDPAIWLDYASAAAFASQRAGHTVGFVLTAGDPWWCLDIDNALQPDNTWSAVAIAFCQALPNTVVEVSQSGRGLHVWGRGVVPPHRKKRIDLGLELYTERRFIAIGSGAHGDMTQPCPTIAKIAADYFPPLPAGEDTPEEGPCADWRGPTDDDDLIRRALQSRNAGSVFGGKASFADLWEANIDILARAYPADASSSEPYDRSSADAALAQHLAFWTGRDVARIERLMRRSALAREKWDQRDDYLVERTIRGACGRQQQVLQDKPTPASPTLTLASAQDRIKDMDGKQAQAAWLSLALQLKRADAEAFLSDVEHRTGINRSALKAELREARQAATNEAMARRVEEIASGRPQVEWVNGSATVVAAEVDRLIASAAAPGEYVSFSGVPSHVTAKPLPFTHLLDNPDEAPPAVPQIEPLNKVSMLARIERAVLLYEQRAKGPCAIDVPDRLIDILLGQSTTAAPTITGLLVHPLVLRDGEILCKDGLHSKSGLFLHRASVPGLRPYGHSEANEALQRLRSVFLEGFEFATALDADVALAGLFTGVQRRILDGAPGLAVVASTQSSGKTTLVRLLHIVLTGHDMPATTFPTNEPEFAKTLLATLLRSPALVCYDNLADGSVMRSASLAAAMTAPSIDQRVLGLSRTASPLTNVLFSLTGNNIELGPDEVSRWLVCRLAPRTDRPEERVFKHTDIAAHGLRIRAEVLRDVVGIVAGFAAQRVPLPGAGTRFPAWDWAVRQPIRWAGGADVAAVFRQNAADNPEGRALGTLLQSLRRIFGDRWFKASDVLGGSPAFSGDQGARQDLAEALEALAIKRPDSTAAVGRVLAGKLGRAQVVDGVLLKLSKAPGSDGSLRFRVESATTL